MPPHPFASAKRTIAHKLTHFVDYSPKGSIDAPVAALIGAINSLPDLVTTSSCSGRVALFCDAPEGGGGGGGGGGCGGGGSGSGKGSGRWLLVSHEGGVSPGAAAVALAAAPAGATCLLKVEPLILHVQARDFSAAVRLLGVALRAGFRESGIVAGTSGRGKLIVAVRSTAAGLEVPLQWAGRAVVAPGGAEFEALIAAANARFDEVAARRARFEAELRGCYAAELAAAADAVAPPPPPLPPPAAPGAAACSECGEAFPSRNALFARHLLPAAAPGGGGGGVALGGRRRCPARAAPAPLAPPAAPLAPRCDECGACFPSRNAVFRHLVVGAGGARRCPSAAAAAATVAGAGASVAVAARAAARALMTRVAARIASAADASEAAHFEACAGGALSPFPGSAPPQLLLRWAHCAAFLPSLGGHASPGAPAGLLVVFGGTAAAGGGGGGVHGRSADAVCVEVFAGGGGAGAALGRCVRVATASADGTAAAAAAAAAAGAEVAAPRARVHAAAAALSCVGDGGGAGMLVFGGHAGPAAPLGDAWLLRVSLRGAGDAAWTALDPHADAAPLPAPRWGHSLVAEVSEEGEGAPPAALLFGGRTAEEAFGDAWRLQLVGGVRSPLALHCTRLATTGAPPCARFSHAAAALRLCGGAAVLAICGGFRAPFSHPDGRGGPCAQVLGDVHLLDLATLAWSAPALSVVPLPPRAAGLADCPASPPAAAAHRFSHTATPVPGAPGTLLLLGGTCVDPQRGGALLLKLPREPGGGGAVAAPVAALAGASYGGAGAWWRGEGAGPARAPHAATEAYVPAAALARSGLRRRHPVAAAPLPLLPLLSRHTATLAAGALLLVGGGGTTFAFGTHFSPPMVVAPAALAAAAAAAAEAGGAAPAEAASTRTPPPPGALQGPLLVVPAAAACDAKTELRAAGLFGWDRRMGALGGGEVCLPLAHGTAREDLLCVQVGAGGARPPTLPRVAALLLSGGARVAAGALAPFAPPPGARRRAPHENDGGAAAVARAAAALTPTVRGWLRDDGADGDAAAALCEPGGDRGAGFPSRVEWLADLLLLPPRAFSSDAWVALLAGGRSGCRAEAVWDCVCGAFRAARLARGARVDAGGTRASRLTLLRARAPRAGAFQLPPPGAPVPADVTCGAAPDVGGGGWVRVKEGGLFYTFDATRLMFSSGNVTEKARMGALRAAGETVVDLFAGLGYFTLPLLARARATHVHACEWNPDAVACLRLNLRAAGADVERRATVWPGDNAALLDAAPALAGAAHRVLLGLIPSSARAWGLALRLLRAEGGVLHVHENAPDGGGAAFWEGTLRPALERLTREREELRARGWRFRLAHCERVKSYAPRVAHYVFDVAVACEEAV